MRPSILAHTTIRFGCKSKGPATRWRICDELIANRGKIAIRVPSHMIAITIRELLEIFPVT